MIKYDKFDQRIINELSNNARIPLTKLSSKVHKNRENVLYRFNRLMKTGIVKSTHATINTKLLGYDQYAIFIQLKKTNEIIESAFISHIQKNTLNSWVGKVVGKWDLIVDIYARNKKEFNNQIALINHSHKSHIQEFIALKLKEKVYTFTKDRFPVKNTLPQLDSLDYSLLWELNKNARISYASLSTKFGLTANALRRRIKLLEKNNIIKGYSAMIDHQILGLEVYGLQISSDADKSIIKIKEYLLGFNNMVFIYEYHKGPWAIEIGIAAKGPNELRIFIQKMKNYLSEEIIITNFYMLLQTISSGTLPKRILKKE